MPDQFENIIKGLTAFTHLPFESHIKKDEREGYDYVTFQADPFYRFTIELYYSRTFFSSSLLYPGPFVGFLLNLDQKVNMSVNEILEWNLKWGSRAGCYTSLNGNTVVLFVHLTLEGLTIPQAHNTLTYMWELADQFTGQENTKSKNYNFIW